MRHSQAIFLLVLAVALAGCGGGDEAASDSAGGTSAQGNAGTQGSERPPALRFGDVEGFTLEHLKGEGTVREECENQRWVESEAQKRKLAPFSGTRRVEVLACDGVAHLAYLEYENKAVAEDGLAGALLAYLVAAETTVVMPLVALDEPTALDYLEALKAECACGEVVRPGQ